MVPPLFTTLNGDVVVLDNIDFVEKVEGWRYTIHLKSGKGIVVSSSSALPEQAKDDHHTLTYRLQQFLIKKYKLK